MVRQLHDNPDTIEEMTQEDLEQRVGPEFSVDSGVAMCGPFIPDGRVRIYDPETLQVVAEGSDEKEAWGSFNSAS